MTIGSATVRAAKVTHQGPTVGYRIEEHGRALVYLPDHEPSLGGHALAARPTDWMSGYDIAHDADVLLHDGQYRDAEYGAHIGWGHSCVATRWSSPASPRSTSSCCSTTTRTTPTSNSKSCSSKRAGMVVQRRRVCLASEGMTISLNGEGVQLRV